MHIECSKEILVNAISKVSKAVSPRSTMPILSHILVRADRDGLTLTARSTDMKIETSPIEAEVYEKGAIAIPSREFENLIRLMPTDIINIKTDDQHKVYIKSGKSSPKINGMDAELYPTDDEITTIEEPIEIESGILKKMIEKTKFSVAKDDSRPVLTGMLFKIDEGALNIVGIDGFRVSWVKHSNNYKGYIELIVPLPSVENVSKLLKDNETVKIYHFARNIKFEMSDCILVSSLLDGNYINYENLFNNTSTINFTVDHTAFLNSLERAMVISSDAKSSAVSLEIKDDTMMVISVSDSGNTSNDELEIQNNTGELNIKFNNKYIVDVLRNIDEDEIVLNLNTNKSPLIIKGEEEDMGEYNYLILPINPT